MEVVHPALFPLQEHTKKALILLKSVVNLLAAVWKIASSADKAALSEPYSQSHLIKIQQIVQKNLKLNRNIFKYPIISVSIDAWTQRSAKNGIAKLPEQIDIEVIDNPSVHRIQEFVFRTLLVIGKTNLIFMSYI